ncbi:MAG: DegT/DnrJ/EryC1/StrS family aminotransferase [Candidatus Omnitrophica bacterium]|nr:DegT/DnrJ/EryC1/StrS family aminotransferase [Candidatus Omnitrophota bacterium]
MDRPLIPFLDLTRQTRILLPELEKAARRVLTSGRFILGREVAFFEKEFARFCGTRYAVGVASGTDALELALRSCGIGAGDAVATVSFSFLATADAILHVGAKPLFIDVEPATYTLDPADLRRRLKAMPPSKRRQVKAVIPVHLFGHPCRMDTLAAVAREFGLKIIEDAAQAAGARWNGRPVGSFGTASCFSFFPTKNLAAFGDGGIVATNSPAIRERILLLRVHGRSGRNGLQVALGRNSRLDELQAAFLRVKLRRLPGWIHKRRQLARLYERELTGLSAVQCQATLPGAAHAFHLFVIRTKKRDFLRKRLAEKGVASQVYYGVPIHRQPVYRKIAGAVHLPVTERLSRETLALPLYPEMRSFHVLKICSLIRTILA